MIRNVSVNILWADDSRRVERVQTRIFANGSVIFIIEYSPWAQAHVRVVVVKLEWSAESVSNVGEAMAVDMYVKYTKCSKRRFQGVFCEQGLKCALHLTHYKDKGNKKGAVCFSLRRDLNRTFSWNFNVIWVTVMIQYVIQHCGWKESFEKINSVHNGTRRRMDNNRMATVHLESEEFHGMFPIGPTLEEGTAGRADE